MQILNLFGNFSFRTGYTRMRCLKLRYLSDFKLADLSGNEVSEQVYFFLLEIVSGNTASA